MPFLMPLPSHRLFDNDEACPSLLIAGQCFQHSVEWFDQNVSQMAYPFANVLTQSQPGFVRKKAIYLLIIHKIQFQVSKYQTSLLPILPELVLVINNGQNLKSHLFVCALSHSMQSQFQSR